MPDGNVSTILYADQRQDQSRRVRAFLESEFGAERVSTTSVAGLQDRVGDQVACVVFDGLDAFDQPTEAVIDTLVSSQPGIETVLLAPDLSAAEIQTAYDAGIDEIVPYTGPETLPILSHHVSRILESGDADTLDEPPGRHLRELIEASDDAVVTIDEANEIRYATSGIEDLFGYTPEAVVGESLTDLMSDQVAARHRESFQRYLETGTRTLEWTDVELVGEHRDGHEVPISVSFSESTVDGERVFSGIIRDISERHTLRQERELFHDTSQRILQAEDFESGLEVALESVGESMNWTYGEVWVPAEDGDQLACLPEQYVATEDAAAFAETAESHTFEKGAGLPGRVWETGEPEWIADVTDDTAGFGRSKEANAAGLHAALGVPITAGEEVVAVLVFLLPEARAMNERMVEATAAVATDLGLLMQRLRIETDLREQEALTSRILDTNPAGILIVDDDGEFTYANERARETLGIPEGERATYEAVDIDLRGSQNTNVAEDVHPYTAVIEHEETIEGEFRFDVDGETHWFFACGAPLADEAGDTMAAIFSFQDITQRKAREQQLARHDAVMQTVSDGIYALDEDGRFLAVNDAYTDLIGYERGELVGEPADRFVDSRTSAKAERLQQHLAKNDHETETLETTLTTADGDVVPIEVSLSLFPREDGHGRVGVVRDISGRKRREERLALLNEVAQTLTRVETPKAVADTVVGAARETLDLPVTSVQLYDDDGGHLTTVAQTDSVTDLVGDGPLFSGTQGIPWQVYAEQEGRVYDHLSDAPEVASDETTLESAIVLPIGTHGVLVTGSTDPDAFTSTEVTLANILASNTLAALERVDREQELRRQRDRLEERNDALARIERINRLIRDITQSLVNAESREEIEQTVCEKLTDGGPYTFSWMAERETVQGASVSPRAAAGEGDGYLDAITISIDGETPESDGPTGRAFLTHEPQVQNNLHTDPPFEPWRTDALQRDFRASIAVPITYGQTLYGVLNIYADETGVFDDMEVAVLKELGEMVGYAINAMERKKMLVSDAAIALEFELDDPDVPAIRFARSNDSIFEFDELVQQADGTYRVFFSISNADPEDVYAFSEHTTSVRDVSFLAERDGAARFEATVTDSGFLGTLISHGAYPKEMSATPDSGRLTVELPRSGDIQSFIQMFLDTFEDAEMISRKERERPVQSREEFQAVYRERLTERQEEVLRTAYFSGFFEWPREHTGQDIADMLDVSQPTVNRHIRNSERKLLDLVFDDSETGG
ncbi:PAS domain S-box protein [Haloarchaeobius amylolyticus]|uniref:PAS domain S-box protein n=1 Tax=Haloarchaeobius amylolyticus TaxID=1198296 RepID=UPI00226E4AF9|nr:PAS domain S-box protein [Haloarchaeobius amylolyticus]